MLVHLIFLWLETMDAIDLKIDTSLIILPLVLIIPIQSFTRHLFRIREVTGNAICAALCLYLLVGLLWGAFYALLESLAPNSFSGVLLDKASSGRETARHLQYFSYVTISTLGYGDITPQTRGAAALCQTEAIIGQFLTLVLVARLVGIQVAQQTEPEPES